MKHVRASRGFTLVELLIVIVVIAILATITIVAYNGVQNKAHASALQAEVTQAVTAIKAYGVSNGKLPTTPGDANVKADTGTALQYYISRPGGLNFCIQATLGSQTYYATRSVGAQSGNCTVTDGLVAEWKLNGNATDTVGGDNGTITGAVATTGENGVTNNAYNFTSGTSYITIPNPVPTTFDGFTVSAWLNSSAIASGGYSYGVLLGVDGTIGTSIFYLGTNASGAYAASADGSSANTYGSTGTYANDGKWHLVTLTYNGSTQTTYLDGQQKVSTALTSITNSTTSLKEFIGSYYPISRPFKGQIDDVRIYNRGLSATDVATLYAAGAF